MTEAEIKQAHSEWRKLVIGTWSSFDQQERDAFTAGAAFGRDKGLAEAAQIPSMMPYVFAVGADIRELESAITALMTTPPHQQQVEPDSDEMARRGAR